MVGRPAAAGPRLEVDDDAVGLARSASRCEANSKISTAIAPSTTKCSARLIAISRRTILSRSGLPRGGRWISAGSGGTSRAGVGRRREREPRVAAHAAMPAHPLDHARDRPVSGRSSRASMPISSWPAEPTDQQLVVKARAEPARLDELDSGERRVRGHGRQQGGTGAGATGCACEPGTGGSAPTGSPRRLTGCEPALSGDERQPRGHGQGERDGVDSRKDWSGAERFIEDDESEQDRHGVRGPGHQRDHGDGRADLQAALEAREGGDTQHDHDSQPGAEQAAIRPPCVIVTAFVAASLAP